VCVWGCKECEPTKSHAVKVVRLCEKYFFLQTNHSSKLIFCPLNHCLPIAHMYVLGVVYLTKRSEWGLAAWFLSSWWCVLWIRNKLPLSNMPSSTRYNGSTGFGRYSPLEGAGNGVQEVHLICRLGYCLVAQSIGLVNTGPDQVSEPKEVEYLTQRTSTDTLVLYIGPGQRRG
jgi:hypothetical protein